MYTINILARTILCKRPNCSKPTQAMTKAFSLQGDTMEPTKSSQEHRADTNETALLESPVIASCRTADQGRVAGSCGQSGSRPTNGVKPTGTAGQPSLVLPHTGWTVTGPLQDLLAPTGPLSIESEPGSVGTVQPPDLSSSAGHGDTGPRPHHPGPMMSPATLALMVGAEPLGRPTGPCTLSDEVQSKGDPLATDGEHGASASSVRITDDTAVSRDGQPSDMVVSGPPTYSFVKHMCRSRTCPVCKERILEAERHRLKAALRKFNHVLMLHLTLKPALFSGPRQAFEHVRTNRCISILMQGLRRTPEVRLHSDRWFVSMEIQPGTGFPHYHVLVDAKYVPHALLHRLWSKCVPTASDPSSADHTALGGVWVSDRPDLGLAFAADYVLKGSPGGYPDWVLDSNDLRWYSTSRFFWQTDDVSPPPPRQVRPPGDPGRRQRSPRRTARQIHQQCGSTTDVLRTTTTVDLQTGEEIETRRWIAEARLSWEARLKLLEMGQPGSPTSVQASSLADALAVLDTGASHPTAVLRGGERLPSLPAVAM